MTTPKLRDDMGQFFTDHRKWQVLLHTNNSKLSSGCVTVCVDFTKDSKPLLLVTCDELGTIDYEFKELGQAMVENSEIRKMLHTVETHLASKREKKYELTDGENVFMQWLLSR